MKRVSSKIENDTKMTKTKFLTIGLVICTFSLFSQQLSQKLHNIDRDSLYKQSYVLKDINQSIDSLFKLYLNKEEHIQGAVISIVSSDSVLLSKGYGFANIKSKTVFDPAQTNVMVASVSKLLTTTAILQLVERSKIRVDQPVSELIGDLEIKNPFNQPVLIRHLLTHTAGFDDTTIGSEVMTVDELGTLKDHLKRRLTPVVWEPGKYFNYSNIGMVLLAYVVETVSGLTFDVYLNKNVYAPLDMGSSGFSYKEASIKNMMTRYKWKEDENDVLFLDDRYGIKYTNQTGAGGFQTTANDMNNFMQMYLKNGKFKNRQILKSETIQTAFDPHFYYHKLMNRKQGLGWKVRKSKGVTYSYHSGDDTGIESIVVLFPDSDIGYFFASNNNEASDLKFQIRNLIIDKIKDKENKESLSPFQSETDLEALAGTYQYMNDGQSTIERLFSYLFGDVYKITTDNNMLSINGIKYNEIDSLLFQREEGGDLFVNFIIDENGSHYSTGYSTYRKISLLEKPSLHLILLIACFVIFLISMVIWIIKYVKTKKVFMPRLYLGLSMFSLVFFFGLLAITTTGGSAKYGVPQIFYFIFTFPLISILFGILGLLRIPKVIYNSSISRFNKLHFVAGLMAIITCLLIYNYYNIIGYKF